MNDKMTLAISERGHLIDILHEKKKGEGTRIGTYNCKTRKLTLDDAPFNILLSDQILIRAGLEEATQEYERRTK
jgi:hypothetical protein